MSDDLFNELAPWAVKAADHWCCRHGIDSRLRSDCVQEALIACWQATRRFDPKIGDVKPFCMCRMIGAIKDSLRREAPLGYRHREKKNWRGVLVFSANVKHLVSHETGKDVEQMFDPEDHRSAKDQHDAEIRDVLDAIGSKLEGRTLLVWVCLRNGMTKPEIAKKLQLGETRVYQLVGEIRERFGPKENGQTISAGGGK
jgi:RNA polymerase sigma factor (sigma-70 family)